MFLSQVSRGNSQTLLQSEDVNIFETVNIDDKTSTVLAVAIVRMLVSPLDYRDYSSLKRK